MAGLFDTLTGDGSKKRMILESGSKATGSDGGDSANVVCMCYENYQKGVYYAA